LIAVNHDAAFHRCANLPEKINTCSRNSPPVASAAVTSSLVDANCATCISISCFYSDHLSRPVTAEFVRSELRDQLDLILQGTLSDSKPTIRAGLSVETTSDRQITKPPTTRTHVGGCTLAVSNPAADISRPVVGAAISCDRMRTSRKQNGHDSGARVFSRLSQNHSRTPTNQRDYTSSADAE